MKTLYGAHRPDEGTITVNGKDEVFSSPEGRHRRRHRHGVPALHAGRQPDRVGEHRARPGTGHRTCRSNIGQARSRIVELGTQYGLEVDPDALVSDLGVGDKQRVEILKVLYRGAKILILDEPTAVLVPQEVDELFASLRELTTQGATIIFISHKLDEVLEHADAITVIRQGKTVGEIADPSTVTSHELAEMMVGSELPTPETRESTVTDVVVLELRELTVANPEAGARNVVDDVSFTVHRGEIVGIAGVEGNGQSELVEAIVGLARVVRARFSSTARTSRRLSTRERRDGGIGYIAEDRQKDGLVLPFTLWENAALGHQHRPPFAKGPWMNVAGAKKQTETIVDEFDVRTPGIDVPAFTLSGGNQQKLDRRPRDDGRAHGAHRLPSDPRRRRRRPGGDLGHPPRRPSRRPRHAPDLGRPRGADRAVRPAARHASRPGRRRPRPGDGDAGRTRFVHDRSEAGAH